MKTLSTDTLDTVIKDAQEHKKIPKKGVVLNLGDGVQTRKAFEKAGYKFHDYEALGIRPDQADILYVDPFPGQMPEVFSILRNQARPGTVLLVLGAEESWEYNGDPGVMHMGTIRTEEDYTYTVYKK
jgi:hypothetical protein